MNIQQLKDKLKSIALLEAIISPEWEYRYFSYDSNWSEDEEMASMRDGEGNTWFSVFKKDIIFYKCISKDDGLIKNHKDIKQMIPEKFNSFINEEAFHTNIATKISIFDNNKWLEFGISNVNHIIDLKTIQHWKAIDYKDWADKYYEKDLDLTSIQNIFTHSIDEHIVKSLNNELCFNDIEHEIEEIGY